MLQYAENLTDRQSADDVRRRLDWKYCLGLELDDPGCDFTVLSTGYGGGSRGGVRGRRYEKCGEGSDSCGSDTGETHETESPQDSPAVRDLRAGSHRRPAGSRERLCPTGGKRDRRPVACVTAQVGVWPTVILRWPSSAISHSGWMVSRAGEP
ncbi:transposase [Streptomyces sp. CoH27]|uniref:transposase n=1 Tax=Streptomyces sp. CoH27 TaxID=2875763 RepID=UPI0027E03C99|nr:transposase [Streptomyces sp. CoH27]